ncbi:MAG: ATP-grasp domain-containing protein [Rubrivivax sp.]|nr:ATP-grasp domain-containing protein [Rubrivivax sp.]
MRILVPEAHAMGSIACIRSLGRAGHTVLACSTDAQALGFRSSFCHESHRVPAEATPSEYRAWLLGLVTSRQIDLVLPSEGVFAAFGDEITTLADRLPVGPDPLAAQRFANKYALFECFLQADDSALREHLPATVLLDRGTDLALAIGRVGLPCFAKFDAAPESQLGATVQRIDNVAAGMPRLAARLERHGRGILQGFSPGCGVGVFFLRWGGRVLATLMHRRLHEVPHTGGASSLRETWWDEDLHADALRRIHAMSWSGVGMLEYRWQGPGSYELMEFNARFWGSLHLALAAGVDFPRLLVEAWSGKAVRPVAGRPGVRCRLTFPNELEYLLSLLRDGNVSLLGKLGALAETVALSLNPAVHSDLWFPGDRGLYFRALSRTPAKFLRRH